MRSALAGCSSCGDRFQRSRAKRISPGVYAGVGACMGLPEALSRAFSNEGFSPMSVFSIAKVSPVDMAVRVAPTLGISDWVGKLKGSSTHDLNQRLRRRIPFAWQG